MTAVGGLEPLNYDHSLYIVITLYHKPFAALSFWYVWQWRLRSRACSKYEVHYFMPYLMQVTGACSAARGVPLVKPCRAWSLFLHKNHSRSANSFDTFFLFSPGDVDQDCSCSTAHSCTTMLISYMCYLSLSLHSLDSRFERILLRPRMDKMWQETAILPMTIGLLLAYEKAINRYSVASRSICVVHLRV